MSLETQAASNSWMNRRKPIAKQVNKYKPDIIGFQEDQPYNLCDFTGTLAISGVHECTVAEAKQFGKLSQMSDLDALMAKYGYSATKSSKKRFASGSGYVEGTSQGARLLYQKKTMTELKSGSLRLDYGTEYLVPQSQQKVSQWGLFKLKKGGQKIAFISVHLTAYSMSNRARLRQLQAATVNKFANAMKKKYKVKTVIIAGDLNSSYVKNTTLHKNIRKGGFVNLRSHAAKAINLSYDTYNGFLPAQHRGKTFDYIYADGIYKNKAISYTNVLPSATAKQKLSDHNMQIAKFYVK